MFFAFRNLQRVEVAYAGGHHLVEDAVVRLKVSGACFPVAESFAADPQALGEISAPGARLLSFHQRGDGGLDLKPLEWRELQPPLRGGAVHVVRIGRKMNDGLTRHSIASPVIKNNSVAVHQGFVIVPGLLAGHASHLENVHVVSFVGQLNDQL